MESNPELAQQAVESAYEAINRRDLDAWLETTTTDVTLYDVPEIPDADVYRGREQVRQWAEQMLEVIDEWRWTPEEFLVNDGSLMIVRVRLSARSQSGVSGEQVVFQVIEVKSNRLATIRGFFSCAQALQAAGLSA